MKKILLFSLFTLSLTIFKVRAQDRYLDAMYTEVNVTSDVTYGSNIGIITQAPALEDLKLDIYEPVGDTVTNRPVVLLLHTGTFLPAVVNGQATGDKKDNALVELCTRLAKKGYVAVSANYRLGWNPLSSDPEVRRATLTQAFYRAQQDARTAVRFLRKSVEEGNPYGIGDKFAVGGEDTGGYMALALAALDKDAEVLLPKFIDSSQNAIDTYGQPVPYIIQSVLGNLDATNSGSTTAMVDHDEDPSTADIEVDVPLCIPNHVGYSSEIDMAFNFGGAMLDTAWIEAGDVPIASMQNINDEFAPYEVDVLTEPVNNAPILEVHGSLPLIRRSTALGNNNCFADLSTTLVDATYGNGDAAANAATAGHSDMPGLFPLVTPAPSATPTPCGMQQWDGAPWQWWDNDLYAATAEAYNAGVYPYPASVWGCLAKLSNPDMSETKGQAFVDMLEAFFAPRIYAALNVDGDIGAPASTSVNGCTNSSADNYNPQATTDDGSCIITACNYPQFFEYDSNYTHADASLCLTYIIEGCTDYLAENFNEQANKDDDSCVIEGCVNPLAENYDSTATYQEATTCLIYGCTNSNAENYQPEANFDNGNCIIGGCTLIYFSNYNPIATYDDGSCDPNSAHIYGCTDISAVNYSLEATRDNGTCEWFSEAESFEMFMPEGWSMFGYTCWESINVEGAFAGMEDKIVIVKDGEGNPYLPEYGYNGLGNLKYARGYQLKLTEEVHGFSFCPIEEELADMIAELDSLYGCTDYYACNYDERAVVDDGSCYNNDLGCGCDIPAAEEGFDCYGNVFFIPETYSFENASYSGQVERLNMLAELEAYLKTVNSGGVIDAAQAKAMYANDGYTWTSYAFADGQPVKNLKSKTFPDQQAAVESLIDQLADLSVNGLTTTSEDGAKTYAFNENGFEPVELIVKGIMGSCFYYQGTSVYLSDDKMDVDNDNLGEGKDYTNMQHHWDEAFGYLGASIDFSGANTGGGIYWGKYAKKTLSGGLTSIDDLMDAFITGRAAIDNKEYAARDEAIGKVRANWEMIPVASALHYLNASLNDITDAALRNHKLSKAIAFTSALKYNSEKSISDSQVDAIIDALGTNLNEVTPAEINQAITLLADAFNITNASDY